MTSWHGILGRGQSIRNLRRNVFGHGLWSYRVPRLVVDEHSAIELTEEVVAPRPELLQLLVLGALDVLILQLVPLRVAVTVKVLLVRLKFSQGALDDHQNWLFLFWNVRQSQNAFIKRELLDGQLII